VMFLVWQFFVGNLLSVVLVLFPDIFVNLYLQFRWPQWLLVWQSISCSTFSEFLYLDFYSLISVVVVVIILTYSGVLFTMELYCTPKSQHTTVKHSRQLFEHTYTSNLSGTGILTPIEFFQQDLLWQPSNTNLHSCSQKVSKHTSGQSIVRLSVHLHTTTAPLH
jgi:hypothetical protein